MKVDALGMWKGAFGNEYVDRNRHSRDKVKHGVRAFRQVLGTLRPRSILEVGSNVGINLLALRRLLGPNVRLYAIEPNRKAFEEVTSNRNIGLSDAWNVDASSIPLNDGAIDLVFTSGVLIHIPPTVLPMTTDEICRVARRHVLCMEYFSHAPVAIPYRNRKGLLFKRDFGGYYLDRHRNLLVERYGFLWQRDFPNYDDLNWWLLRKKASR
jgi:pseudaminic acid biosynthesis-associated methylase